MVSRLRFRPRCTVVEPQRDRGTKGERPGGWPSKAVGVARRRELMARSGFGQPESSGVDTREKLWAEAVWRPYRKPTQVGEASSLR